MTRTARAEGLTRLLFAGLLLRFGKGGLRSREGDGHSRFEPLERRLIRFHV